MKIAYFGLGKMGLGPALHLQRAGYEVHSAIHHSAAGAEALQAEGGIVDKTPAAAVRGAKAIFTIVPDDAALKELLLSPALLAALEPGAVLVDMTSCSAGAIQAVAAEFEQRGVLVLDAPVSGGTAAANAGTMTMMCAGSRAAYEQAMPLLQVVGKKITLVSEAVGDGKKVKSLNNLLSAIGKAAVGEVARMAKANNLDFDKFYDVVSNSSGNSDAFRQTWDCIQKNDFNATFTVAHMRKDVDLALGLADGMNLPMSKLAGEYYHKAAAFDGEDSCAVAKVEY